jgi:hypothetical protein
MTVILALGRLRQGDFKSKSSQGYIVRKTLRGLLRTNGGSEIKKADIVPGLFTCRISTPNDHCNSKTLLSGFFKSKN